MLGHQKNLSSQVMILRKYLFWALFLSAFQSGAQNLTYNGFPSLNWPVLYSVTYKSGSTEDGEVKIPVFNEKLRALEGKSIVLPGYMVPSSNGLKVQEFMLSSLPLNACFFCGVGGPETVVLVRLKRTESFNDKPVEVRGVLRLLPSDPDGMIYVLDQGEILGEIEF